MIKRFGFGARTGFRRFGFEQKPITGKWFNLKVVSVWFRTHNRIKINRFRNQFEWFVWFLPSLGWMCTTSLGVAALGWKKPPGNSGIVDGVILVYWVCRVDHHSVIFHRATARILCIVSPIFLEFFMATSRGVSTFRARRVFGGN